MDILYQLNQIQPAHRPSVGDKALHLATLSQQGCPVIPGIVISAQLPQAFLEQIDWGDPLFADFPHSTLHVDVDNARQLQAIAQHIRRAIQTTPFPQDWLQPIVAATQDWGSPALILRPSLSLRSDGDPLISRRTTGLLTAHSCPSQPDTLALAIKQAWAELFRAKSLLYWQRLGIPLQTVNVGLLVQPWLGAIATGEVRQHPVYRHDLEIRGIWGLGNASTTGEVWPDTYHINSQAALLSYQASQKTYAYGLPQVYTPFLLQPATQSGLGGAAQPSQPPHPDQPPHPVLSPEHLQQLAQLTQTATETLGIPLDLEWLLGASTTHGDPTLHITQVIPRLIPIAPPFTRPTPPSSPLAAVSLSGLAAAGGQTVAPAWVISHVPDATEFPPTGSILVIPTLTSDWLPWLKQMAGVITEQGGMTSHGAILARELGIPGVVGVTQATRLIQTGDRLSIDGDRGTVILHPNPSEPELPKPGLPDAEGISPVTHPPAWGDRPHTTQLLVTLSQPESLAHLRHRPIDGIGLLRSEFMLLNVLDNQSPPHWIQRGQQQELTQRIALQLQRFAAAVAPHPVFYRTFDGQATPPLSSPAFTLPTAPAREVNPMLGLRGTFCYTIDPTVFQAELAALRQVQQAGYSNVRLVLPFVRTVEEFIACRHYVEQAGLTQDPAFQLWIMAEVPSVLFLLPDYVRAGVQGIVIGTNDLTQLLLGVDRDQAQFVQTFQPNHPAVMAAIAQLIQAAHQLQIPCSVCIQPTKNAPDGADSIETFVRWGVTAISVELNQVETAYRAIALAEERL